MFERSSVGWVFVGAIVALPLATSFAFAASKCQISPVADLPITMDNLRPTIPAKINNKDARFLLDSGAFFSTISSATAAEYELSLRPGPFGFRVSGIGGSAAVSLTTVKEFGLLGVTIKNVEFIVAGSETGGAGVLGQNLLQKFDVEYNLAAGSIRLFHTDDCDKALMAYWVTPEQHYSVMRIDHVEPAHPHTIGTAYINGAEIRVLFDTGAATSILSTKAASRAGIKIDSEGVVAAGYSRGIGRGMIKTYIARFDSFKIGDGEEIKNAKLRIGDIELPTADMLLGADFFISHRVFVANKEHRLFLTYNGGPVFDLSKRVAIESAADADGTADAVVAEPAAQDRAAAAASPSAASTESNPAAAAELARHGSALAARRDFVPALADLSKAVALSPNEPEYYFQRANAYLGNQQPDLALADFNQVIKLKEDFLPAYIPRAELELQKDDKSAVIKDLDTVEHLAPKPADLRFMLGRMYERLDRYSSAAAQYAIWLQYHEDDSRRVAALSNRCLSLAMENQDLPGALDDCNIALRKVDRKLNTGYAHIYVNRGLVRLRQYEYEKAIADFNDALKVLPKTALALYGRGIAELRTQKKADGERDVAAAGAIAPKIAERFTKFGIGI